MSWKQSLKRPLLSPGKRWRTVRETYPPDEESFSNSPSSVDGNELRFFRESCGWQDMFFGFVTD
jgi:hypothetical protein